jgi:hypothetical protein
MTCVQIHQVANGSARASSRSISHRDVVDGSEKCSAAKAVVRGVVESVF